jgi:hypothetical protein
MSWVNTCRKGFFCAPHDNTTSGWVIFDTVIYPKVGLMLRVFLGKESQGGFETFWTYQLMTYHETCKPTEIGRVSTEATVARPITTQRNVKILGLSNE